MNKVWVQVLVKILLPVVVITLSGLSGYYLHKPDVMVIDKTKPAKTDTLWLPAKPSPVIYKSIPAKHDTVIRFKDKLIHVQPDTIMPRFVAGFDTLLTVNGITYGKLGVSYFIPFDTFDMQFNPAKLPHVTNTVYVKQEQKWYENRWLIFGVGLAAGVATDRALK